MSSARQFLSKSALLSTRDNVQRCQDNSAILCRRLFAVQVEAPVDLAVDFQADLVLEASQEALVVGPLVVMEVALEVGMEVPMEVVMEEAVSVGEELHSGSGEAMVESRKAREVDDG